MRELSSRSTLFTKFVLPTLWIGAFATATIALLVAYSRGLRKGAEIRWGLLGVTILGTILSYWGCMGLKRVSLGAGGFVVSNYLHEITIPLRDVERVSGTVLVNPQVVCLHLRTNTRFGSKIFFIPKHDGFFGGFTPHPIVKELRTLVTKSGVYA